MISAIAAQPGMAGNTADYRFRPVTGDRTLLRDSTPSVPKNATSSNNGRFEDPERKAPPQPEQQQRDPASMFAAAVIAGALPPVPQTMEQLIQRIGMSTIPEESEARLKDLLA